MNTERERIPVEQAVAMLPEGDRIHTFRQAGPILVGADWPRSDIVDAFRTQGVELAGEQATKMNHGLVFFDEKGPVFVATRKGGCMIDQVCEILRRQAIERIDANASGIAKELAEAEDQKLTVSISLKLTKLQGKVAVDSALSYGRKFKDEGEDIIELADEQQPDLIKVNARK